MPLCQPVICPLSGQCNAPFMSKATLDSPCETSVSDEIYLHDLFICYPHELRAPAAEMKRGIERVQGRRRLRRASRVNVFMDEAGMSGDIALWGQLSAHLRGSKNLLVVTEYGLREESYVHKEVGYWLEHHRIDHLMVVLGCGKVDDAAPGAGIALPPPLAGLPEDQLAFEPRILAYDDYRGAGRGAFGVDVKHPKYLFASILAAIVEPARTPEQILRQQLRWLASLSFIPIVGILAALLMVVAAANAAQNRERSVAVQLQQEDLVGNGFSGIRLRDATYTGKAFDRANFEESALLNITITRSSGQGAKFGEATLERVKFLGASFANSEFSCLDLSAAEEAGEPCVGATLRNVVIDAGSLFDDADFNFARLDNLQIENTSLRDATFVGASGTGLTIVDSDVRGARFGHSTIEKLTFVDLCYDDTTVWPAGFVPTPPLSRSCK